MVAVQVMGNDAAIGFAASQGNFELNVFMPVIAYNTCMSVRCSSTSIRSFDERCASGDHGPIARGWTTTRMTRSCSSRASTLPSAMRTRPRSHVRPLTRDEPGATRVWSLGLPYRRGVRRSIQARRRWYSVAEGSPPAPLASRGQGRATWSRGIETRACRQGIGRGTASRAMVPIIQSTTFRYETSEHMGAALRPRGSGYFYTRLQNPPNDAVAAKISPRSRVGPRECSRLRPGGQLLLVFNILRDGRACGGVVDDLRRHVQPARLTRFSRWASRPTFVSPRLHAPTSSMRPSAPTPGASSARPSQTPRSRSLPSRGRCGRALRTVCPSSSTTPFPRP